MSMNGTFHFQPVEIESCPRSYSNANPSKYIHYTFLVMMMMMTAALEEEVEEAGDAEAQE